MVLEFVSRGFGVGLHLNKIELNEVNDRRSSEIWGSYLSKDEALTIYGTIKKKKIIDKLTLVRFFDVGVNLEGFWNYDKMSLQVEDIFDILAVKFPNLIFSCCLTSQVVMAR